MTEKHNKVQLKQFEVVLTPFVPDGQNCCMLIAHIKIIKINDTPDNIRFLQGGVIPTIYQI